MKMTIKIEIGRSEVGPNDSYYVRVESDHLPATVSYCRNLRDTLPSIEGFIQEAWRYDQGYEAGLKASEQVAAHTSTEIIAELARRGVEPYTSQGEAA